MTRGAKTTPKRAFKFKVSLTPLEAYDAARVFEKLGLRKKGQKVEVEKAHGWAGEKDYNRQGFGKGARFAILELVKQESQIDARRAELLQKQQELEKEAKRLGLDAI